MSVDIKEDFDGFKGKFESAAHEALDTVAIIVQTNVQSLLSKHGVATSVAKRFGITDKARSSEPGQPPGLRTGTLRRSIQIDRSENIGETPAVEVGTGLIYARIHELGGRHHPKRPFLVPGDSMSTSAIELATKAVFRKVVRKFRGVT